MSDVAMISLLAISAVTIRFTKTFKYFNMYECTSFCCDKSLDTCQKNFVYVENKKQRAATEDIAILALEDIAKYFDLPIVEASKTLEVGRSNL